MSTTTSNLGLFKYDTTLDAKAPFSIDDALNQNWNKIDSSVVKKSGDTMTGLLNINSADGYYSGLQFQHPDYETGSIPANNLFFPYLKFVDTNERQVSEIYHSIRTTGESNFVINSKSISDSGSDKYIIMSQKIDGSFAFTFPNTTCCDGQWVTLNQKIISSSTSLVGSSNLSYTVNVPNDGHYYEIIVEGQVRSNNTKNYWGSLQVITSLGNFMISQAKSETDTVNDGMSCVTIPLGTNRNLQVQRQNTFSNFQCSCLQLTVKAYRRIGTNS